MIEIYCIDHHRKETLCEDCFELSKYAQRRIDKCQFGNDKPICRKCNIYCYQDFYKEKIKTVMQHSGKKMLFRHPLLTLQHFIDHWRSQ